MENHNKLITNQNIDLFHKLFVSNVSTIKNVITKTCLNIGLTLSCLRSKGYRTNKIHNQNDIEYRVKEDLI